MERGALAVGIGLAAAAAAYLIMRQRQGKTLPFHIVDVFTIGDGGASGNQLLVVDDRKESLSDSEMQAIAAEIGFAESAFVRSSGGVRIFTIDEEVPQAGHPIIGLSEIIGGPCSYAGKQMTLLTKKGPVAVESGGASTWFMSQDPPQWLGSASKGSVALLLKAGAESLVGETFPIGSTCGLPYALVPVASASALDALEISPGASAVDFQAQCTELSNGLAVYFYTARHGAGGGTSYRTRMFCHEGGLWVEDVATGSAAGPLACHLAPCEAAFTQGSSRRATIHVSAPSREGARVRVGGAVERVACGRWKPRPA